MSQSEQDVSESQRLISPASDDRTSDDTSNTNEVQLIIYVADTGQT